ncbi:hypothetical protein [Leptothoe sp. PORK10 BA2]|uniref:hypothetical protein n=1 Tax=Leptothoe sp. PORK10 BA2 TaxID=3110254 RepID=UPI002B206B77|nr:hypothetical protein [Leptothoe sp. PORK10 BA2]MEA5462633.1 hypothetical protein [Leptothoe sp. PORK10 BA2]
MKLNTFSALLGAISLLAMPLTSPLRAEELSCPDQFSGIELSDLQVDQLQSLEDQFGDTLDNVALSPETETQMEQLEKAFEEKVMALLSPEQEQQIAELDDWANNRVAEIAPELLTETGDEPALTDDQEAALELVEAEYDQAFASLLTPEQQQQLAILEAELDAEMEALEPDLSAEEETSLDTAETQFEQGLMEILSEEQRQQLSRNLESCGAAGF